MATTASLSKTENRPWLLYSYPWMPFPRRLAIYLAEKRIPDTTIKMVHVSDPQHGDCVVASQASLYPPRPKGSLPILALPPPSGYNPTEWTYIGQTMAIIEFIEEACSAGELRSLAARKLVTGENALERARLRAIQTLAEELTITWNPVRMFGTNAGTIAFPEGANEMYKWVDRTVANLEPLMAARNIDPAALADDETPVSVGDITLFQFLEFVDYCYGVDMTVGSGEIKKDVYGRATTESYPVLNSCYEAFKKRKSARRDGEGETARPEVLQRMQYWHPGAR